jgi:hypothetical protein
MNGKGFIVINPEQPTPRGMTYHEHEHIENARIEAVRLAEQNPGKLFVVYEAVLHARRREPVEVRDPREPNDDDLPF